MQMYGNFEGFPFNSALFGPLGNIMTLLMPMTFVSLIRTRQNWMVVLDIFYVHPENWGNYPI